MTRLTNKRNTISVNRRKYLRDLHANDYITAFTIRENKTFYYSDHKTHIAMAKAIYTRFGDRVIWLQGNNAPEVLDCLKEVIRKGELCFKEFHHGLMKTSSNLDEVMAESAKLQPVVDKAWMVTNMQPNTNNIQPESLVDKVKKYFQSFF